MQVRITRSAETDLLEGYAFYEEQQTGIGEYFLDSLFADINALAPFAGIDPKPIRNLHRTLAKRFPFAIYCELTNEIASVDFRGKHNAAKTIPVPLNRCHDRLCHQQRRRSL